MIFGGIQKISTIDYPGVLSCVVFTKGCDLDCFYCHNRELIDGSSGSVSKEEVMSFLKKRAGLLDGVVVSGGEPAIQSDLAEFLQEVRSIGFKVKLDTNGQHPDVIKDILDKGVVDYFAVDIKALPKDFTSVCSSDKFSSTKQTVDLLSESNACYELRTTLYPGMTIEDLGNLFSLFTEQKLWRLNFFRYPQAYKDEDIEKLNRPALSKADIEHSLISLTAIQPNLIY